MRRKIRNRQQVIQTWQSNDTVQSFDIKIKKIGKRSLLRKLKKQKFIKKPQTYHKIQQFINNTKLRQFSQLFNHSTFQCPICLSLIISPILMQCGHLYCYRCLESNNIFNKRCSLCRQEEEDKRIIKYKNMEKIIQKFILKDNQEIFQYLCRIAENIQWQKLRKVNEIKQGIRIDFKYLWGKWGKGIIYKILKNNKILIKYSYNNVQITQILDQHTHRIASYGFFTKNKYLENQFTIKIEDVGREKQESMIDFGSSSLGQRDSMVRIDEQVNGQNSIEGEELGDQMLMLFELDMKQNQLFL